MRHQFTPSQTALAESSKLITGATFCPNWATVNCKMPVLANVILKLCCQRRRRRITRESGDGRGGNTQQR
ncbi:hypothetical protein LINPERPRIM_LOCUS26923 [Linum perenne]